MPMVGKAPFRNALLLSLEAQAIVLFAFFTPYVPFSVFTALSLFVTASLLLAAGVIFYQKSDRGFQGLILLYLLVALVAAAAYLYTDSLLMAVVCPVLFYWRLHRMAEETITRTDLTKRFTLVMLVYVCLLIWLLLRQNSLITGVYTLLTVSTLWYLASGYLEFVTREKRALHASGGKLPVLTGQQLGVHALLIGGYVLAATAAYYVLGLLWGLIKGPILDLIKLILIPLVGWLEGLLEQMKQKLSQKPALNELLSPPDGIMREEITGPPPGEDLISRLEPYLIMLGIVLVIAGLGWIMWKRYRQNKEPYVTEDVIVPVEIQVEKLDTPSHEGQEPAESRLQKWQVPENDRIRYAYYQFLLHLGKNGLLISGEETSSEYLRRLRKRLSDERLIQLAQVITSVYEQYRYGNKQLSEKEMQQLENSVEELQSRLGGAIQSPAGAMHGVS
ncbi:MAG: DUF4129 domain-containing protein [Clostridia bacterium]